MQNQALYLFAENKTITGHPSPQSKSEMKRSQYQAGTFIKSKVSQRRTAFFLSSNPDDKSQNQRSFHLRMYFEYT